MWKIIFPLVLIIGLIPVTILFANKQKNVSYKLPVPEQRHVLLIIADSLMPEPLNDLIEAGELPGLSFLKANGYITELVSTFPTMSVVNDASLITGTYPDEHRIPGLVWFDRSHDRFVNYGDSAGNILQQGVLQVANDAIIHLNERHLNMHVQTIHEQLAQKNISSANVNLMVRRGDRSHPLRFPFNKLLAASSISGPTQLNLGYLIRDNTRRFPLPFNKYGLGNRQTEAMTLELMKQPNPPQLIVTYLSEPDKQIHKRGPHVTRPIYAVDRFVRNILDSFPAWEDALNGWTIIVMGDSGQVPIKKDNKTALISVDSLLSPYVLRGLGTNSSNADLAIALNERMAYIYPLKSSIPFEPLAVQITDDRRIDIVAYIEGEQVHTFTEQGHLSFRPGGSVMDTYGQRWEVFGDASILDVKSIDKMWGYGKYPDVFRQLYSALQAQPEPVLIMTAKPGYEFQFQSSPTHVGGGSHGGLSKQELIVPLIVGGTADKPAHNRLVDIKPFIVEYLTKRPTANEHNTNKVMNKNG